MTFPLSNYLLMQKKFDKIVIGTQTWSDQNLAITIGLTLGTDYYYPNNNINNVADFGLLYTKSAADIIAASVSGWHLPSLAEWQTLETYLGGSSVAGGKLKSTGLTYWNTPNAGATNETLFNGRGSGYRFIGDGNYYGFMTDAFIWSSTLYSGTNYFAFSLYNTVDDSDTGTIASENSACSLRLIKD